jgi:hypothetical protein
MTRDRRPQLPADAVHARPLSVRLCDALVLLFAGWTLVCNAVVFLSGGYRDLLIAASLVAITCAAGLVAVRRSEAWRAWIARDAERAADSGAASAQRPLPAVSAAVGWIGALLLTAYATRTENVRALWVAVAVYFVFALVETLRSGDPPQPIPRRDLAWERALWVLAACAGILPLFAHNFSTDDGFYVNLAVAALDDPALPLLRYDTLHGIADLPILRAVYQLSSFELLGATVAFVTGLAAIQAMHWVVPALFGPFVVLAYAQLFRELAPQRWLWSLCAALCVLVLIEETQQFYGGFALMRIQQGKAVFVSIFAPLLIVYALQFARRPRRRTWLLLCATQIASVGATTTALWAGPAIAGLALISGMPLSWRGLRTALTGAAASAYAVTAALVFRARMLAEGVASAASEENGVRLVRIFSDPIHDGGELVAAAWSTVHGTARFSAVCFFAVLVAWVVCRKTPAQRLCAVFPLGVLLVLLNPWTALALAHGVTGGPTYWRVLWVLPLPALLGVLLTAPLGQSGRRLGRRARVAATLLLCLCFVTIAPTRFGLFGSGVEYWQPLGLKVKRLHYEPAAAMAAHAPPRSHVLLPTGVSTWMPTFHHHPYPLVSRSAYLVDRGVADEARRLMLHGLVTGRAHPNAPFLLRRAIEDYDLSGVCFRREIDAAEAFRRTLTALGFERIHTNEVYETWVRAQTAQPP